MRPATVQHDYAADDPEWLANQLEEISRLAKDQNPYSEVDVVFYQAELQVVVRALRRART